MITNKKILLISACLTGCNCKYNGGNNKLKGLNALQEKYSLIPVCPEQLGGLSTPREASEIICNSVVNKIGEDVSKEFMCGAESVLKIAEENNCDLCLFKERSPSCGVNEIYDGSFTGKIISGSGITTKLLKKHGITVLSEEETSKLI